MGNLNKILGGLLIAALIYIIFLNGCGNHKCPKSEIVEVIKRDSITHIDTIRFDTTVVKYLTAPVPVPYYDTISKFASPRVDDFDDLLNERPMVYQDTVSDDTVSINYRIKVWGFIDKIDIGYKVFTPYSIVKTTTIETEVVKKKAFNGFYLGMDLGIIKDSLSHLTPTLEASFRRFNCNVGFDLMDKDIIVGARFKIGK